MDGELLMILRMKRGEEQAMEAFVRRYYPQILHYCRWHVRSPESAEDLTQETFARFFRVLGGYRHVGKAVCYLYTIAANLCRDEYGKNRELPSDMSLYSEGEVPEEVLAATEDGGMEVSAVRRLDVRRALLNLSPELREVVILYYFQERSQKEIAEILKIGLSLVKYRLRRAKEELGKRL